MDFEPFRELSTPLVADACMRLKVALHVAPAGLAPILPGTKAAGRVLPVRHYGSVDVFLEAFDSARGGEVCVIDNGGRSDEGCIGDLTVLEARDAGLAAVAVWGLHRDSAELAEIAFPVFSYGTVPAGPARLDPRDNEALSSSRFGDFIVGPEHAAFLDSDGGVFVAMSDVAAVLETAARIHATERRQAELIAAGESLRDQLRFSEYLDRRSGDSSHSFRDHLRGIGGAIEE